MSDLSQAYFTWLYDQAFKIRDIESRYSYIIVCDHMNRTPFLATVPHDENRVAEGTALRNEYFETTRISAHDPSRLELLMPDASIFEVLISLARRAGFMMEVEPHVWFDIFITNLNLGRFKDLNYKPQDIWPIERILKRFNERKYTATGRGGIFPLKNTNCPDQRTVELWYQMSAYMTENRMY